MNATRRYFRQPLGILGAALAAVLILTALFAPVLAPYNTETGRLDEFSKAPSRAHWLGTDHVGVDVLSRLIMGSRLSLTICLGASLLTVAIGMSLGVLAGYAGGWTDLVVARVIDIMLAFPGLLLILILAVAFGARGGGLAGVLLSLALVSWAPVAQLVRAQVLSLKGREFVTAGRVLGATHARLILRHILPNCMSLLIVVFTMRLGTMILAETSLSFLGLGASGDGNSWGLMVNLSYDDIQAHWWQSVFPASAIALTVIAFNLVGDSLRDALDPKLRID